MPRIKDLAEYFIKCSDKIKSNNKDLILSNLKFCKNISNENIYVGNVDEILEIDNIHYLDLSNQNLTEIPDLILKMKNLRVLNLSGNKIKSCEILNQLHSINILIAKSCQIKNIPDEIGLLKNLIIVDLSDNSISQLSSALLSLPLLSGLMLHKNKIKTIPDEISLCRNLQKIDLSLNVLKTVNPELWKASNLKHLNLSYNEIEQIRFSSEKNNSLIYLNIENNKITEIDENIINYKKLKRFFVNGNQLKSIPSELTQLKNLQSFYFKDNPFDDMPDLQNIGSLNLFSYLNKTSDKTYEVEWLIPKEIKTAFQQYMIYFPDFVEKNTGNSVPFDILSTKSGLKLITQRTSKVGIKEINHYIKQYIDFLKYTSDEILEIAENKTEKNIDYYKSKQLIREVLREKHSLSEKINEYFEKLTLSENEFSDKQQNQGLQFQINYFESLSSDHLKIIKNKTSNILKQNFNVEITNTVNSLPESTE
jgi:Leucine-rich repeat (LRR) protein